jgi:hypothetical protein
MFIGRKKLEEWFSSSVVAGGGENCGTGALLLVAVETAFKKSEKRKKEM